jgi:ABC-type Mn2+/Zn2+ transport system permease subunit
MRAFLAALVVAAVIAVVGAFVLERMQEPVSEAYSTNGVRL